MVEGKIVWVRADVPANYEERKKLASSALEAGFADILIREEDKNLPRLGRFNAFIIGGEDVFFEGNKVGTMVTITGPADLKKASALRDKVEYVIISAKDWRVIPLENLIAEFQGSGSKLLAVASTPEEAKLFLETMEVGADGVVIEPSDSTALTSFHTIAARTPAPVALTAVPITRIAPLTIGDRVCVDTCSLLRVGEGMLIGSQSSCLFLVSSESMESEYVASRPFRVNAGAVHAYVLTASGKTRYLSEVRGGDELLAIDAEGHSRNVVVGRAKVERRPLLLIEVEADGRKYTTILQNAETIRLVTPEGPVSITDLRPGHKVLVRLEKGGRHFGHAINETIVEI
jgi:3-dehydroquinate synthase II